MANKLYVVDPDTGVCELMNLTPYPTVSSTDASIDVTVTADAVTGQKNYDVQVHHDINMDTVSYNPVTMIITWTETDGDTGQVDLSSLLSIVDGTVAGHQIAVHHDGNGTSVVINETITSLSLTGAGFTYVDENGGSTVIDLCPMMINVTDNGNYIGG